MKRRYLLLTAAALLVGAVALAQTRGAVSTVYTQVLAGGAQRMVVSSGAFLDVESGGEIDVESGGSLKLAGTAVSATAAELNLLDTSTAGSIVASKAIVADSNGALADADLLLNSTNEINVTIGAVSLLALDDAAISGNTAATDTAGKDAYLETQDGGGTPTAARTGGLLNIKTGDGSGAATTIDAGAGGALSLISGAGGAQTGADASGVGGAGGAVAVTGGVGGATDNTGSDNGGAGGGVTITGGAGGNASAGTGDGGAGGNITLTPGGGGTSSGGVAGEPGAVVISTGPFYMARQTIDMADAGVSLAVTPASAHTTLTGNLLFVDANSAGTENLELPPEGDSDGLYLRIINTGGESILLKNDAAGDPSPAAVTVLTAEVGECFCDGTTWYCYNQG